MRSRHLAPSFFAIVLLALYLLLASCQQQQHSAQQQQQQHTYAYAIASSQHSTQYVLCYLSKRSTYGLCATATRAIVSRADCTQSAQDARLTLCQRYVYVKNAASVRAHTRSLVRYLRRHHVKTYVVRAQQ